MVTLISFGYKAGLPPQGAIVHDCRVLRNPHREPGLRDSDGIDRAVQTFVERSDGFDAIYNAARSHALADRNSTIAFGCYGGRHRSAAIVELLAADLRRLGCDVSVEHRQLWKAVA